jgi:hypothetical protein
VLLLDPLPPVLKYLLDLPPSHPLWNDKPDRLAPASLQSPSPRPGRAPNLDPVHQIETNGRSGRGRQMPPTGMATPASNRLASSGMTMRR